jgi:DNA modification methylase
VLRDDGVLFLNLGDSYASGSGGDRRMGDPTNPKAGGAAEWRSAARPQVIGAKPKDLLMIPARVALALQADGWWLRSDIIWHKPNPMPESVTDRPTSAHEHVFLLAKAARYYWDADAVAEAMTGVPHAPGNLKLDASRNDHASMGDIWGASGTRNIRNVWTIATQPYADAHFATFPPELAERCIKAGSRPGDTILDPFAGAFTAPMAADRLQRNAIGIELSADYCAMARRRLVNDGGLFMELVM